MTCPSCGFENVDGARFCAQCAAPLNASPACPQCGASNAPGSRFCNQCAHPLAGAPSQPALAPAGTSDPRSFGAGRYQVKRFLGEGGKKRVYLAQDTRLDRDVAFALIKTEGLDAEGRVRIGREAQAMGRLGDHPHIVAIHDIGDEPSTGSGQGGQPFIVSQFMPGGDVEGLIAGAEDHRLPLDQALRIAAEVCRGLDHAHGHGIVHRDLKPGNVWLTASGTAKLGDFGLAVALDRSRLTQAGMMVGTVAYMPPEQALGGEVTPRSDLYSLGAMLYEMVTGRPPFLGGDAVAVIGQHLNTAPVAPSWHQPECSKLLESLILRLLAKDPAERPASAQEVLAAIEAIDLTAAPAPTSEAPVESNVLDSLAGGVFVGRQREMGELKAALEEALSGRGRLLTLVGEPGIGKTRTAQELATYAALRQAQVLWGRCYEGTGAPPYWPWVQLIRSYVRERDPRQLRSEMGAGAADIAELVSDVRERLPNLRPAPQLEPEQARFRLFDSITTFLKTASRRRPLVLVLEDLHWADRPSLLLLEFLARELAGGRLLVVGTYRDVDLSRQHPLALTLGELTRERLFLRIVLRGLSREDVARFVELTTGLVPPSGLVETLYTQTEGNPLFLTEVVRLLAQEGELSRERIGSDETWSVRIPEGVREVVGRRLSRLSDRCNQVLTVAAAIGRQFDLDQVACLFDDISRDRLLEVLEEALGARIVEELPRAAGRYQFTHALIQETLVEELTTTRRVQLHARIGEALERLYGDQAATHAAELALHFGEAATLVGPEKLVRYSLLAGGRALEGYAWEEALAHFRRGLAAKEDREVDADTAALLDGAGRAHIRMLQLAEGLTALTRAFDYYAQVGDVERAIAAADCPLPALARVLAGAPELIARALDLVSAGSAEAGRLLSRYGHVRYFQESDYDGAQEAFSGALEIARREADRGLELRVLGSSSFIDLYHCRWDDGLAKALQGIELAQQGEDLVAQASARSAASLLSWWKGDGNAGRDHAIALLGAAERLRDRSWLAWAHYFQQYGAWLAGEWGAAREVGVRGLTFAPRDVRLIAFLALVEHETGNIEAGREVAERLLAGVRSTPHPTGDHVTIAWLIPLMGHITGEAWQFDAARAACEAVLAAPMPAYYRLFSRQGLALMAVQTGDAPAAAQQYPHLLQFPSSYGMVGQLSRGRMLGVAAGAAGDLETATRHLDEGLAFCRKAGYRPELAWTCFDYADALLRWDRPSDHDRATALLGEALAIARELEMRPLMERVLSRREILRA